MYLDKINIENYGSIDKFAYTFRFDEKGNPIPLILVGKNGSGKTLVLANIVDALVEAKRKAYPERLLEVALNKYYKLGSKRYIKVGKQHSFVSIDAHYNNKKFNSTDVMANDVEWFNTNKQKILADASITMDENGFYRNNTSPLNEKDFEKFALVYFPIDRYYVPTWFNAENYKKINEDINEKFVRQASRNFIKIDIATNIKNWLRDVFLSRIVQIEQPTGWNQQFYTQWTPIQKGILNILGTILNNNTAIPRVSYKDNHISIANSNSTASVDFNNLSSGEMMLIGIFLSILKDYDYTQPNAPASDEVVGIVLIDEIDLNLHIGQQEKILPRLIKMFPKVQFIITSHSPFFVKGMCETFGTKCDIVNMPDGELLTSIDDFSEIKETIDIFNKDYTKLHNEIAKLRNATKPIIITEGPTDIDYIKLAYSKNGKMAPDVIWQNAGSDINVKYNLKTIQNMKLGQTVIGIFDRDNLSTISKPDFNIREERYLSLAHNVYAFAIPLPEHRKNDDSEKERISIEHYLTDKELKTEVEIDGIKRRLFSADEFKKRTNKHKSQNLYWTDCQYSQKSPIAILSGSDKEKVISGKEDGKTYNLSKQAFVDFIKEDKEGFNNFDFTKLTAITDIIDELIAKVKTQ